MIIHKSAEDYLEMILMLKEEKGYVRSIDIAQGLGVSKPSVSVAMKQLRENGYIRMNQDNFIHLTDPGYEIAHRMLVRHKTLTALLMKLGVNEKDAREDACKIEHDISPATFDALVKLLDSKIDQD